MRRYLAMKRLKTYYFIKKIIKDRKEAVNKITKNMKCFYIRSLYLKLKNSEKSHISIRWIDDPMPKRVQVIGSFSNPPWQKLITLEFCPLRKIFIKYLTDIQEGIYLIKFIVDGV